MIVSFYSCGFVWLFLCFGLSETFLRIVICVLWDFWAFREDRLKETEAEYFLIREGKDECWDVF